MYNHNWGLHINEVPQPVDVGLRNGFRDYIVAVTTYSVATGLIKVSFGLTLLRIVRNGTHRGISIALKVIMALFIIFTTFFSFVDIFSCSPVQYSWDRFLDPYFEMLTQGGDPAAHGLKPGGHCLTQTFFENVLYAWSTVQIIMDVLLGIVIPILLLKDLPLKRNLKIMTGGLLSLGALATVITIIRFVYIHQIALSPEFLYTMVPTFTLCVAEATVNMVAISCTTLKPLIVKLTKKSTSQVKSDEFNANHFHHSPSESTESDIRRSEDVETAAGAEKNNLPEQPEVGNERISPSSHS